MQIYADGGARGNPGPAASAFVALDGKVIHEEARYLGKTTNNVAEYNGALMALEWFVKNQERFRGRVLNMYLDSQLVVRQLRGIYRVKSQRIKPLVIKIKELERKIEANINYFSVPRKKNVRPDSLLNKKIDENI